MKRWTPPLRDYRNFSAEKPPVDNPQETPEQRIARVLAAMPAKIFNDPQWRIKALKKAAL